MAHSSVRSWILDEISCHKLGKISSQYSWGREGSFFFFWGGGGTKITYPRPYPNVALFTSFQYDDFPAFPFGGIWTNRSLESIVIY